jgi:hypothetical protein
MSDSDDPAAPHGSNKRIIVTVRGHKKVEIILTVSAGLLDRVDEVARRKEISREALLRLLIGDGLAKWEAA